MSDEVILKTSFMGFDKKEVIDYIESLQKENRELKKRISQLEGRPIPQDQTEESETVDETAEPLPKIQNVNLQNPLEDESSDDSEQTAEISPVNAEEEEFEPDVAAAMNRADEAIAQADESIVLNDDKYSDAVTAIYNAVMEAVSNSDEIQVELENEKKDSASKSSEESEREPDLQPKPEKARNPVKVKVKIKPKKEE